MSEQTSQAVFTGDFEPLEDLGRLQKKAWIVAIVGLVGMGIAYTVDTPHFLQAYLVGWLMCVCLAGGVFAMSLLGNVSNGEWIGVMRPVSEASGRTFPFIFLLGLPIAFHLKDLYKWAKLTPEEDPVLAAKEFWLTTDITSVTALGGVYSRAVLYFVIWTLLAYKLSSISRKFNETGDLKYKESLKHWGAGGMVVYVLTGTFASVDWIMAMDFHWFSSLFGFAWIGGQLLAAFAFSAIALNWLKDRKPYSQIIRKKIFHDYGKLMLAFTVLWAYFTVSQFLIIWSADLPEEVPWYLDRSTAGFKELSVAVVLGHFVLPFAVLLSAALKKKPHILAMVGVWILAMRWLDFYWLIVPSLHHGKEGYAMPGWQEPVVVIGLLALWLALTIGQYKGRKALPVHEPIIKELASHG